MSVNISQNQTMTDVLKSNITTNNITCSGNTSCYVTDNNDVTDNSPIQRALDGLAYFDYFYFPTFLLLGFVGNTLTIILMNTNKKYSKLTSRIFLTCLALSDTLLLLTQPFNKKFVIKMLGKDMRALSNLGCKIFFVIFRTAKMTSSWLVVSLCFERFIAVWFPLKAKVINTKSRAIIVTVLVYLVMITFNSVWSFSSLVVNGMCFPDSYDRADPYLSAKYEKMIYLGCTLYTLAPIAIMSILTPLIIYKLAVHRQNRERLTSRGHNTGSDGTKTTAMLLGIVAAFIVLVLPVTMLHLMAFFFNVNAFENNAKGFILFKEISQLLEQLNYSINFFLYIMTSTQFRDGIIQLLPIHKCLQRIRGFRDSNTAGKLPNVRNSPNGNEVCDNGGIDSRGQINEAHLDKIVEEASPSTAPDAGANNF